MWRSVGGAAMAIAAGSIGCRERATVKAKADSPVAVALETSRCQDRLLRPATAAPAEGLWVFARSRTGRVAVMVGPSRVQPGGALVTRRVETIETDPDGRTIHRASDTAAVHLELLPTPLDSLGVDAARPELESGPAAVYTVAPRIVVASYEPCAASGAPPRLRYLRRDGDGRPVVDVMLWRVSGGT